MRRAARPAAALCRNGCLSFAHKLPSCRARQLVQVGAEIDKHDEHDPSKPWTITAKWIRDSFKYNEWMSELDYELTPEEVKHLEVGRVLWLDT